VTTTTTIILISVIVIAFVLIIGSVIAIFVVRLRPRKVRARSVRAPVTDMDPDMFGDRVELPPPYPGAFARSGLASSRTAAETAPVFMTTTSRQNNAAIVDEEMRADDERARGTAQSNDRRIGVDGVFVPETPNVYAKFDGAVLRPLPPGNRCRSNSNSNGIYDNSGFIPDDESVTDYEHGAAASLSASSTSPSAAFVLHPLQSRFQLRKPPHHYRQHHHQDRHREPPSDRRVSQDVLSWSPLSTPSDERQLQYPICREPTSFGRVPDVAGGSELVSGNVSVAGIGSKSPGTTPSSARSISPLARQVSASTSMTSSITAASPATCEIDLRPSDEDIDYY